MNRKRTMVGLVLMLLMCQLLAQGEANHWYFGNYAGLDFSAGPPVAVTDGQIETLEGCAAISSPEGELLFYTDGSLVWGNNHVITPNGTGLMGHSSSTQSAIIVPNPVHDHLFYIFTVDAQENSLLNGLRYSVFDMTLNGGLGDVTAEKNVLLVDPTCEKVTAVKHGSENKYWVVTHLWTNNIFQAFLVDENGVNTKPVISAVGDPVVGTYESAQGYLKISPDGNWLVMANNYMDNVLIFDFDNISGEVSNQIRDDRFAVDSKPYGVEFSPNSQVLYICNWGWFGETTTLYQYNLNLPNAMDILNSRIEIAAYENLFGALQLGPDEKIYMANAQDNYLGVINQPNVIGTGCDYDRFGLYLAGRTSNWGLPPFIQSFFNVIVDFYYEHPCFGEETQFYEDCSQEPDSVYWDFGDAASGLNNTSSLPDPVHLFTSAGSYNVRLIAYFEANADSITKEVSIYDIPPVSLGPDTAFCAGDTYTLNAGAGFSGYLWQNGSTAQSIVTDTAGIFWVEVSDQNGCINRDSITLTADTGDYVRADTSICPGESIFLGGAVQISAGIYFDTLSNKTACDSIVETSLTVNDTFYVVNPVSICTGDSVWAGGGWQTQSGTYYDHWLSQAACDSTVVTELVVDDVINVNITEDACEGDSVFAEGNWQTQSGTYYDTAMSVMGCDSITTLQLYFHESSLRQKDTSICDGDSIYLENAYQTRAGTYQDNYTTIYGCDSLVSTILSIDLPPTPDLGNDTILPIGISYELNAYNPGSSYLWQDGSTEAYYLVTADGTYIVTVSNTCGSNSDTIGIMFEDFSCRPMLPNAFTPDGDGLNDIFLPEFSCDLTEYELMIFDRWGSMVHKTQTPYEGWDGNIDGEPAPAALYSWVLNYRTGPNLNAEIQQEKGSLILIR